MRHRRGATGQSASPNMGYASRIVFAASDKGAEQDASYLPTFGCMDATSSPRAQIGQVDMH
jgi:hypothetical protein